MVLSLITFFEKERQNGEPLLPLKSVAEVSCCVNSCFLIVLNILFSASCKRLATRFEYLRFFVYQLQKMQVISCNVQKRSSHFQNLFLLLMCAILYGVRDVIYIIQYV